MKYNPVTTEIIDELVEIVGKKNVISDKEKIETYSHDETPAEQYNHMPEVVVTPKTTKEIAKIVKLANKELIPITPRGAGSGLSGGAIPVFGGIVISMEKMNRVLDIDYNNMMMVLEPGVVTNDINEEITEHGLFFAGYPMSVETCYIGGNIAENAGGGKAVKYGVTGRYVMGLEVVTPTGEVVDLGGTISGEHGIGLKRKPYMKIVTSPVELELMRKIKKAFFSISYHSCIELSGFLTRVAWRLPSPACP